MYKWILLFLLIPSVCYGAINEKYSYKDFTYKSFKDVPAKEFNNTTIIGSCFYQKLEDKDVKRKDIFPDGIVGVVFLDNNMDNVLIPEGNTTGGRNSNKILKLQNDLHLWVLDENFKLIEPKNKADYIKYNLSILPKDIPLTKQSDSIVNTTKKEK